VDHRPLPRRRRAALAAVPTVLLLAGCGVEDREAYPHIGEPAGWTQGSVARTVLLYLVVPIAFTALVYLLVYIPAARHRNRYRPNEGWSAEPVWFAGPADPVAAVEQAPTGDVVKGGAGGSW
jgi:heme/copper-type cytochrome/quinol oxidase subunit 2